METVTPNVIDPHPAAFSETDLDALRNACLTLEHPSLAARLSGVVGTPVEIALQLLPRTWYDRLHGVLEAAIRKALDTAMASMGAYREYSAHETYHKLMAAGSGAVGGFFGLPGLVLELPITTTIMLRSICEIARDEGEDLADPDTLAACIEVFAFGGRSELDDAAETGYYGVRLALGTYVSSTLAAAAVRGVESSGGLFTQLIRAVATRFGVTISQRAAARLVPVVGAAGGAVVNTIFMQHFQDMARAHFTVRRLERRYGETWVRTQYESISAKDHASA